MQCTIMDVCRGADTHGRAGPPTWIRRRSLHSYVLTRIPYFSIPNGSAVGAHLHRVACRCMRALGWRCSAAKPHLGVYARPRQRPSRPRSRGIPSRPGGGGSRAKASSHMRKPHTSDQASMLPSSLYLRCSRADPRAPSLRCRPCFMRIAPRLRPVQRGDAPATA